MKSETVAFEVSSAFGSKLPEVLKASYDVDLFENRKEIPEKKELDDDQYVQAVNAREKASKRAKATATALDIASKAWVAAGNTGINPYEKPDQNTPEVQRASMIKTLAKMKKISEADAAIIVDAMSSAAATV